MRNEPAMTKCCVCDGEGFGIPMGSGLYVCVFCDHVFCERCVQEPIVPRAEPEGHADG